VRQINVTKRICLVTTAAALGALGLLTGCGSGHRSIQPVAASSPVAGAVQSAGPGSIPAVISAAARPAGDQATATCYDSCGQTEPVLFTSGNYTGIEPSRIGFSADSGNVVTGISWTSWTAGTAIGHGAVSHNNCIPDCAQGTVTPGAATIILSDPGGGTPTVWQHMVEQEDTGVTLTWSYPGNWPLSASGGHL